MTLYQLNAPLAFGSVEQLRRIERAVSRFFSGREKVDLHELAMKLWEENPDMALSIIRLRCISASKEREAEVFDRQPTDLFSIRDEVNSLCAGLDTQTMKLLYLRFWCDLTIEQIAARLDLQPKAVRSSLRHWLFVLRCRAERKGT